MNMQNTVLQMNACFEILNEFKFDFKTWDKFKVEDNKLVFESSFNSESVFVITLDIAGFPSQVIAEGSRMESESLSDLLSSLGYGDNEKIFRIPVTWMVSGEMNIKAATLQDATRKAVYEMPLPNNGSYIDDSIELDEDSPFFGEIIN